MIHILPKIYGTYGINCGDMRFIKIKDHSKTDTIWRKIDKLIPGVWISKKEVFIDWNNMFFRIRDEI